PARPRGRARADQMFSACVQSRTDLSAETAVRQRDRIAGDGLPVEPGRARGADLRTKIEIGADGERDAALPLRVLPGSQLDDGTGRTVAGGVEMRQLDVMGPPVGAVDHGISGALQLVVEAALDQAADDGNVKAFAGEDIAGRAAFDAAFGQGTVHALDDVAALAQFTQDRFGFGLDEPLREADLFGKPADFKGSQPPHLQSMKLVRLAVGKRGKVDDAGLAGVAHKLPVELRPAFRLDLPLQIAVDLQIGAGPEFLRDQILRTGAHALLDVVAGN